MRSSHTTTEHTHSLQLEKNPHSNKDPAQPQMNKSVLENLQFFSGFYLGFPLNL